MTPAVAEGAPPAAAPERVLETESEVDAFRRQLERRVNEVVDFDGKKHCSGGRKAGGGSRYGPYGGHSRGPPDLFRLFGVILREVTSRDWARPFMEPVDVVALKLDDYYEIISKPMDFSTIQNKMEGKDGSKYNNVREICSDVRLIFANAMKYNDEQNAVHRMAKRLLEIFEEKWLQLLPKVENEERRQMEESKDAVGTNTSREAAIAKLAKDTDDELSEINKQLEKLRKMVVQRCRKITTDEKRKLGAGLWHLSPEDLSKALEIVAQDNPSFQTKAEVVDLDMDAQSETTLWRLKFFVKEALERRADVVPGKVDENAKRKREICDALAKTALKRIKKQP
ncbi:transcription factor GTE1-like isoform X2 [Phragmites australis]|uniref:transcription factor GTE1-like isoform X2 n=1 Tax=Phragmites australis TaxID=29695 RepID=UPI002D794E02|nr:transcription factor GTE1-like isoform X2 [Phragmites australis]